MVALEKCPGAKVENSYIVVLNDGFDVTQWLENFPLIRDRSGFYVYEADFLNGFVGELEEDEVTRMCSPEFEASVESVSENGLTFTQTLNQTDAPWGISRISQDDKHAESNALKSAFDYKYNETPFEVNVYLVDTGIRIEHEEFEDRARWGVNYIGGEDDDIHGHGTHCAGMIAGRRFGVAKEAKLIAVKVFNRKGRSPHGTIIKGLQWVRKDVRSQHPRIPSIVNMSFGGPASKVLDKQVRKLIESGIHAIAAAGNHNNDAVYYSPARIESVITAGASTFRDTRAWFSNTGSLVDIYAPGVFTKSAGILSNNELELKTGTSMSCAHVTGLVAYLIGVNGNESPRKMKKRIEDLSIKDALQGIPLGSNNKLARNDIPTCIVAKVKFSKRIIVYNGSTVPLVSWEPDLTNRPEWCYLGPAATTNESLVPMGLIVKKTRNIVQEMDAWHRVWWDDKSNHSLWRGDAPEGYVSLASYLHDEATTPPDDKVRHVMAVHKDFVSMMHIGRQIWVGEESGAVWDLSTGRTDPYTDTGAFVACNECNKFPDNAHALDSSRVKMTSPLPKIG